MGSIWTSMCGPGSCWQAGEKYVRSYPSSIGLGLSTNLLFAPPPTVFLATHIPGSLPVSLKGIFSFANPSAS